MFFFLYTNNREGKEWKELRKPAQEKMLRPAVVASYGPLIEQVTDDFIDILKRKKTIDDLQMTLSNYTTESNIVEKELKAQLDVLNELKKENQLDDYLQKDPNFMYSLLADSRMTLGKIY
ncbi:Hypothetical predicted protein [Mytilus galloprovincialis]|uniref:Uncharacterized protein n=1 Tax=Mytilus galloprovincialis TaxID=29158 RepID=A0A8B6DS74_MYTGA|nr:Hypothetical predicted protein [Mytilus galloprovincialis]